MNNKAIKKYIRQVRRIYHGNRKIRRQFIQDLEDSLFYYSERHLNCTYSDLVKKFGTPDEIQESFSEIIPDKIKKRNLRLYYFIIFSCSFLTIMLVGFTIYHAIDAFEYSKGYYKVYLTSPDEPTTPPIADPPENTPIIEYTFD